MQVKHVGVISYAKISAVTNAAFGLLIGILYGLIFMVFGAAIMAGEDATQPEGE
jgi:dihydroxyacetone kinase